MKLKSETYWWSQQVGCVSDLHAKRQLSDQAKKSYPSLLNIQVNSTNQERSIKATSWNIYVSMSEWELQTIS